jgi:hypothetical protein
MEAQIKINLTVAKLGKPLYTPKFILDVNILKNGFCVV